MTAWLAPAKVNLTLMVRSIAAGGLHPIQSLMQTLYWGDRLTVTQGEDDHLEIEGAELPAGRDNLVWKAVEALEKGADIARPPLRVHLDKRVPVAAGLGGGSADAATMLAALGRMLDLDPRVLRRVAPHIGSDVPAALRGGSLWVEGFGERVSPFSSLSGFALAVAVPDFPLLTADVYRMWDHLEGPRGSEFPSAALPPPLRRSMPFRNDLQPAALRARPELGDAMHLLSREWGRPVAMSGSGPSLFGYFMDEEEARSASEQVENLFATTVGVDLFSGGPTETSR